jgi:hypothetical protein
MLRKISKNLVLVEASRFPKDKVNYNFLEGAKFPKREIWPGGGQIFGGGGANFL